jgi:hypothetical protein
MVGRVKGRTRDMRLAGAEARWPVAAGPITTPAVFVQLCSGRAASGLGARSRERSRIPPTGVPSKCVRSCSSIRLCRILCLRTPRSAPLTFDGGVMMSSPDSSLLRRLHEAMNQHDLEAFLACFHPQYRSEQPAHPDRAFGGVEQVRNNWSEISAGIPDFRADLVRSSSDGGAFWAEWEWGAQTRMAQRFSCVR